MSAARIIFVRKKTKLVYQHNNSAPKYNLTAIEIVKLGDGKIYWKCKVKEPDWYKEVIITPDDFETDRVDFKER